MIRALLTDLDGVIRIWDGKAAQIAEEKFGLPPGIMRQTAFASELVTQAITGVVTDEVWREEIAERLQTVVPNADTNAAVQLWSAEPGQIDEEALDLIRACRRQAKVVLVTNATSRLPGDLSTLGLTEEFDAVINSSVVGVAKPQRQIFEVALQAAGVSAGEALFIDDRSENVEGAVALGLAGHVYISAETLRAELQRSMLI